MIENSEVNAVRYGNVIEGRFLSRPNRFIALVETEEGTQTVHVKNTGRCKELLVKGAKVYLAMGSNPNRKTAYDLIAVEKGDVLINMDSQAPNKVFAEWAREGGFPDSVTDIHPEVRYGESRLDFALQTDDGMHFVEVKGVTLEKDGNARFPDAPTERGVRHILELKKAVEKGHKASICFILQFSGAKSLSPNDDTHPEFGTALRDAARSGVNVYAYDCYVTPDSILIDREVPILL